MEFWEKVKRDIQKGIKEGVDIIKAKAEELTEEGKKRLKLFELKTKVQGEISNLGGKVYDLSSTAKNPLLDSKVKAIVGKIKKLEAQIAKIEGKKKASRKTTKRRT
jgi:hypothetical protein